MITDYFKYKRWLLRNTLNSRGLDKTEQLVAFYRKDLKALFEEFKMELDKIGAPVLNEEVVNNILCLTEDM